MTRALLAITLILTLFGNAFLKSAVLFEFKFNQEYISQTMCVQKEIENNTCKGTCHLSKQLEKTEEQQDDIPVSNEELQEILVFFPISSELDEFMRQEENIFTPSSSSLLSTEVNHSIFHPPQLV